MYKSRNWKAPFYIKNSTIKIIGFNGKPNDIEERREYLFNGKESLGSGGIHIWSRTILLLKNTLLLGYGPGNFPMYFPQNDYTSP